jgi:hypothetical protein
VLVAARSVVLGRKRTVGVRVRCRSQRRCRGTLAVTRGSKKPRSSLGRTKFLIPSHQSKVVRVKLSRYWEKRLLRARRLSCKATVSMRISGRKIVVDAPLVLKAR